MELNKDEDNDQGSNRWIVSYADFITLLFALFVVLYSMSTINQQKYETTIQAISNALKSQDFKKEDKKNINTIKPDLDSGFELFKKSIHESLYNSLPNNLLVVREEQDWIEIELKNSVLFDQGSTKLVETSLPLLKKIALKLMAIPNVIQVEGFTDNTPVQNQLYPSNWELSAARSAAIVRKLEEFGIESERMSVVGYGKNYPIADNKLDNGPAQNRRVKLLILKYTKRSRLESLKFTPPVTTYKSLPTKNLQDIHPVNSEEGNIRFTNVKDRKESSFDLKP